MKKIIFGIVFLLAIVIVCGIVYVHSILGRIRRTELPGTDEELGIIHEVDVIDSYGDKPSPTPSPSSDIIKGGSMDKGVENILIFGLDRRNADTASRSDTIMVVSIDRNTKIIKVTSLMRDMYVPIPGREDNRINASYAFGGPALAIRTVNSNFALDVREFITIDFAGFEKIIDEIGGIRINVKANEVPYCHVKGPGLQTLNGMQALSYARIRHVGHADYERTERQRRVLNEIFKTVKSRGVLELPGTVSELLPYVETNLSNQRLIELSMGILNFNTGSMKQFRLPVDGCFKSRNINGMSVLVPDIPENKKRLHEFIYDNK